MANNNFDDDRPEETESRLDRIEREEQESKKAEEQKKKKKRFNIFDSQRVGKGVSKDEKKYPPNLLGFWQSYRRNFGRLLSVNILMILGNFPMFFLIAGWAEFTKIAYSQPLSGLYSILSAIHISEEVTSPATLAIMGIDGLKGTAYAYTPLTYVMLGLGLLVIFTFGITNAGTTYILRNLITGAPVFAVSDFFYAIKRNFKQAFFYGILDITLLFLIPFNIFNLLQSSGGYFNGVMLWLNIAFGLIYIFMRFYIYLQMVTFDLSIWKILKNSLIFAFIGFKRNITALAGILILVGINLFLFTIPYTMSIAVVLPFLFTISNCTFMSTYAAYFKIKELMIDPYVKPEEENPEEPLAIDRG